MDRLVNKILSSFIRRCATRSALLVILLASSAESFDIYPLEDGIIALYGHVWDRFDAKRFRAVAMWCSGRARSLKHTEVYGVRSGNHDSAILKKDDDFDGDDRYRDELLQGTHDEVDFMKAKHAAEKGVDITEGMVQSLNRQFV